MEHQSLAAVIDRYLTHLRHLLRVPDVSALGQYRFQMRSLKRGGTSTYSRSRTLAAAPAQSRGPPARDATRRASNSSR